MSRTTQASDRRTLRRRLPARGHRAAGPAPRPAIRMPDVTPWTAPAVHVTAPDPDGWPSGMPRSGREDPPNGWWVMYTLDTETGELAARANKWTYPAGPDLGSGYQGGYDAATGTWVGYYSWAGGSRRIGFPCRSWLDAARVAADLELIAPRARRLIQSLQPVPGTGAWDWTVAAAAAHEVITSFTRDRYDEADEALLGRLEARHAATLAAGMITFDALLALYPELGQAWPGLAAMPDAELDEIARKLCAHGGAPSLPDELLAGGEAARKGWHDRMRDAGYSHAYLAGARAGMYELRARRAEAATGYPVTDAGRFLAANPGLTARLTADTADDALARAAADLTARIAHDDHISLAGTAEALTAARAGLRVAARAELEQAGRDVTAAEDLGRHLRTARAGLVARVIAWRDPADYGNGTLDEAALARRAGMTQHGLGQLRDRLAQEPDA